MAYCDFVVKWNPKEEGVKVLTDRVFYSLFAKRLKSNKPAVIFMGGMSGEGKSESAIAFAKKLLECQGVTDFLGIMDKVNVYTPLEYVQKLDDLLYSKDCKDLNVLVNHESRDVVGAKLWYSFINRAIADVNAQSRSIKRLCFILVSQNLRDITTDIRYTLNFYCKVKRPRGKPARVYIRIVYEDDRDIEKVRLRTRRLSGYYVLPSGRYVRFIPKYIEIERLDKEIVKKFEVRDTEAKKEKVRHKMQELVKELEKEVYTGKDKIDKMLELYTTNLSMMNLIGKRTPKRGFKAFAHLKQLHGITDLELKEFEVKFSSRLKELEED